MFVAQAAPEGKQASVDAADDEECEIVRSNKGGPKLIHRGYIYTVHKQRPGSVRWRCTRRSLLCKGSMMTASIDQNTTKKVLTPHNHVPDRHLVARTITRGRRCEAAEEVDPAETPPLLEENLNALGRLKNLGTAVQVKTNTPHAVHHHKRKSKYCHEPAPASDESMPTLFDQHEWQFKEWPQNKSSPKGSKDFDAHAEAKPVTPLKVSKRIMAKKQMRKLSQGDEYFSQIKGNKDTKMKIVKVTRSGEAPDVGASSSLLVRKLPMAELPPPPLDDLEDEEVCLKWNSHHSNMQSAFPFLLAREQYVDVTLCSEGQSIRCHKLVLSACSTYFDEIISGMTPWQHPVIYLKGIPFWVLKALIDFMYVGEVSIEQSKLQQILDAGEELKIKGLTTQAPQQSAPFSYLQVPEMQSATAGLLPPAGGALKTTSMKLGGAHNLVPTKAQNVFKIALNKEQLTKLSAEETNKLLKGALHRKLPPPLPPSQAASNMVSLLNKSFAPLKEGAVQAPHGTLAKDEKKPEPEISKEKPKAANKRPAKRRLSDANSPLPDHLQFVRKGTRSRPLVKTPKIYQTEVSPKRESRDRGTPISEDTSSSYAISPHKDVSPEKPPPAHGDQQPPVLKPMAYFRDKTLFSATSDTPYHHPPTIGASGGANDEEDYLQIAQIKQEPIDISETDVSYGNFLNEENVLRFDEDEPGEQNDDDDDDLLLGGGSQEEEEEFMEVITPTMEQEHELEQMDAGQSEAEPSKSAEDLLAGATQEANDCPMLEKQQDAG